jgi:hypothetical protein
VEGFRIGIQFLIPISTGAPVPQAPLPDMADERGLAGVFPKAAGHKLRVWDVVEVPIKLRKRIFFPVNGSLV